MKYRISIALCVALMTFSGCNDSEKKSAVSTDNKQVEEKKTLSGDNFNYKFNSSSSTVATNPKFMIKSETIEAQNLAPQAIITVNTTNINPRTGICFSALNSSDVDGTIVDYKWVDKDDNILSTDATFTKCFQFLGDYDLTLYVTDDKGMTCCTTMTINVTEPIHKAIKTTIIHINDHHSHLASESKSLYFNGKKTYVKMGGFPRVVTKIKDLQMSEINPITLHAGDMIQGTLFYTLFKSQPDIEMMNQIKWDAVTLGNHEFDDGDEGLKEILDGLDESISVISSNVVAQCGSMLAHLWEPYKIIERDGEKIGIIGLDIGQKTEVSSSPSDKITFLDELLTAQRYADELKNQGVNKIILLSHNGMKNDLDYASKLDGVDVIIDGDSHSLVGDFSMVGLTGVYDRYPQETTSKSGERVCVASAWQYSYAVGNMVVDFDENGKVTSCNGETTILLGDSFRQKDASGAKVDVNATEKEAILAVINSTKQLEIVTEDSDSLEKLKVYSDEIDVKKAEVVGSAGEVLGHNRIPGDIKDGVNNLPLGSDIAPLVAKSFYDKSLRADACIQNAGGVRVAIDQGPIDIELAYTLLPFSNTLFELDMTGAEIKQVLEDSITNFLDNGGSTGSFPYAYGLKYDVDLSQAANSRIANLEILNRENKTWSTIDNTKTYVIVTNDYIAAGRDGYTTFKTVQDERGEGVNTYYDYAMSFVDMVKALKAEDKELTKLPMQEHPIKSFKQ